MSRFKIKLLIAVPLVITALLLAIPLLAHHGAAAFDVTKMVTVKAPSLISNT